jgi:hypothetical protein
MGLAATTSLSGEAHRHAIASLPTLSLLIWSKDEYF